MIVGIVFVVCGLLIIMYPPLLSIIVACTLIFWGISFMVLSYYYKRAATRIDNPYMDMIIRF